MLASSRSTDLRSVSPFASPMVSIRKMLGMPKGSSPPTQPAATAKAKPRERRSLKHPAKAALAMAEMGEHDEVNDEVNDVGTPGEETQDDVDASSAFSDGDSEGVAGVDIHGVACGDILEALGSVAKSSMAASSGSGSEVAALVWSSTGIASASTSGDAGSKWIPPPPLTATLGAVFCTKCRQEVQVFRAQLHAKSAGTWKCNACNVRIVQLHRAFGSWPPPEFRDLNEDDQAVFYKNAHSLLSCDKVVNLATAVLERIFTQRFIESSGGSYLPLSVYAREGYDAKQIQKECKDTMIHPVLGLCYRVAIFSKRTEQEHTDRSVQTLLAEGKQKIVMAKDKKKREKGQQEHTDEEQPRKQSKKHKNAKKPRSTSSSSNSSTSASTSSSSSSDSSQGSGQKAKKLRDKDKKAKRKAAEKAKKKASKQAEKDKKAKEAAKKRELEEKKRKSRVDGEASKLKAKLAPLLVLFARVLDDDFAKHLPSSNLKAAESFVAMLGEYEAEVKGILVGKKKDFGTPVAVIDEQIKLAKKELQLLDALVGALRKHRS